MPNSIKLEPKLSRLALESNETPVFANVWSKGRAYLLLCGELNLPYAPAQTITAGILSKLDQLWLNQATDVDTMEETLEQILLELNQTLLQLFSPYPYNPNAPRYHLTISAVRGTEICVAVLGKASAFVVSAEKFTNIVKVGTNNETDAVLQRKPIFQQLISGSLRANEAVFLVNPNALDYFSVTQLRKLVGQYSPGQCVNQIRTIIKDLEYQPAISLIIYKLEPLAQESELAPIAKITKSASLSDKLSFFKRFTRRRQTAPAITISQSAIISAKKPSTTKFLSFARQIILFIKNIPWRRTDLKNKLTAWLNNLTIKYNDLPNSQKVLTFVIVLLIFILSYSIVANGKNNLSQKNLQTYNQTISQIKDTLTQIESSIIYRDDNQSSYLLSQVQTELNKIPKNNTYRDLLARYQTLVQKSYKQTIINSPYLWHDLKKTSDSAWRGLITVNKTILAFDQKGTIAELTSNAASKVVAVPASLGSPKIVLPCEGNRLLIKTDSNTQLLVDLKTKKISTIARTMPTITDAVVYADNRLYFITGATIERSNISAGDLSSPIKWLKGDEQLPNNATTFTVDGSIFVATSSGNIIKYSRGYKTDFTAAQIVPALQKITKIKTTSDQDNLYLLDSDNKRIIIINKKGELISQLMLPSLNNISDFSVSSDKSNLFVLSDNQVYKIKL